MGCSARHRAQALKLYHTRQRGEVLSRGRVYARACARAKEARPKTACQFVAVRLLLDRVHVDRQVKRAMGVGEDGDRIVGGSW